MGLLLGSDFNADFASVIFMIDAVAFPLVLLGLFFDEISGGCTRVLKRTHSILTFLKTHFGARHK